jgi:hypothetical protein
LYASHLPSGRPCPVSSGAISLKRLGFSTQRIVELLERHPDGIAKKYEGRLRQEVERAYDKIKAGTNRGTKPQQPTLMICAAELATKTFPIIKYIVPEILVQGLTLLAGKPKVGKSWLLLHAALAVARGGFTLGDKHCIEGDVLYCALEDGEQRLQSRMRKLIGQGGPKRLTFCYSMPRLADGGLTVIRDWTLAHPEARLIVIDTLAMVRSPKKQDESTYDADYAAVLELRQLATEFGIAIVVVHHLRKADSDDAFDTVSGTLGLTGAPDSVLILKRNHTGRFVLHGKGRDLIEFEKAICFDRDACTWRIEGEAADLRRSTERAAILEALDAADAPIGPNMIATMTGMRAANIRQLLAKMVEDGTIERAGYGKYRRKAPSPPQSESVSGG